MTMAMGIRLAALVLLPWTSLLGGCATPAVSEAMIPETASIEKTHPYSVSIEGTGGRAPEPTGLGCLRLERLRTRRRPY